VQSLLVLSVDNILAVFTIMMCSIRSIGLELCCVFYAFDIIKLKALYKSAVAILYTCVLISPSCYRSKAHNRGNISTFKFELTQYCRLKDISLQKMKIRIAFDTFPLYHFLLTMYMGEQDSAWHFHDIIYLLQKRLPIPR
jgi:hypothetical protein